MFINQFIQDFSTLGQYLVKWLDGDTADPALDGALDQAYRINPFFTPYMQRHAIRVIAETFLSKQILENWLKRYFLTGCSPSGFDKVLGIIMAGNIPLVGFHDFLCGLACGRKLRIKLSSKDQILLPLLFDKLCRINPFWSDKVIFLNPPGQGDQKLSRWIQDMQGVSALISTGSDQTAVQISEKFHGIPSLIRGRRFSFAVIKEGSNLEGLPEDVFLYFGLGCRNINYFLIPEKYDLCNLVEFLQKGRTLVAETCYMDIYKRNRAILMMEGVEFTDGEFFLLQPTEEQALPMGVLGYIRYQSESDITAFETEKIETIQKKYCTFGQAQAPAIDEYADGVDTMEFILNN